MAAKKVSPFVEFLLNTMAGALESVGEIKLVDLLQKLHDGEPENWKACILSGHAFIIPLKKLVGKTTTKIDDGFVAALDEAITMSAENNGLDLSTS